MKKYSKFPLPPAGKEWFAIIIFTENVTGALNQVTTVFARRQLNIESINASPSGYDGLHRYTLTCLSDEATIQRIVSQLEKKIDIAMARYYRESDVFIMEQALYKISTPLLAQNKEISRAIRQYAARIVEVNDTFAIVTIEGLPADIEGLYQRLQDLGALLQFVGSGMIAVTKEKEEELSVFLAQQEEAEKRAKEA